MQEARELVASNEVEVLDVRDDEHWLEGHIPGSHHAAAGLAAKLATIPEDRKLLIVSESGDPGSDVADELEDREAVTLEGGMDAWQSDGLRTQPSEDYAPGPAPIEGVDDDQAAEATDGTLDDEGDGGDEESARDEKGARVT